VPAVSERVKQPLAACLACLLALTVLAQVAFHAGAFRDLDARALNRLSADRDGAPGDIARAVAYLGDPVPQLVLLGLACLLALRLGRPRRAIAAAILVGGADLSAQALKVALAQPRYQSLLGYYQVGTEAFPSGHATATMAMALACLLVVPRAWRVPVAIVGGVATASVGCAVVVLHRHYPSDVLGGWLLAAVWFFALVTALRARRDTFVDAGSVPGARHRR
jgi:membrane-associated phospholipid phosphatase